MTQPWHKISDDLGARIFSKNFWERHRAAIQSGEFWADKIKHLRNQPVARLQLALENLPLPAAFREGAIALRSIIRDRRKVNESYEQELQLLYWFAAIDSFSIPYSTKLSTPGYNVMEIVPGEVLKSLAFSYAELGYEQLPLLSKTDFKWLTEAWGSPNSHTTLHKFHQDVWDHYEQELGAVMKKREEDFIAILRANPEAAEAILQTSSLLRFLNTSD